MIFDFRSGHLCSKTPLNEVYFSCVGCSVSASNNPLFSSLFGGATSPGMVGIRDVQIGWVHPHNIRAFFAHSLFLRHNSTF